ncbi:LytR/AlgR family response regulator transcription factor [Bowmanella dokdonensis]|uniref:Response regulator transcription factor n=1 Tax=Bowmanella dokdonensis TaxID=751969 RepID=A0A939DMR4_9ALTE|nr:LytTR family DNA-binding domain-containing protein [Bowmanella dokdonensis]MBN7825338.1 response regulator transcription factor [Bowmanella dokdonensis]
MNKVTVLIADDEALAREGMLLLLQDLENVEVIACCEEGQQALETIQSLRPDIAFLDIEMPNLNGRQIVEVLRRAPQLNTQLVYVTAFDQFAVEAYAQGVQDYLLKPVSHERLQDCIQRFCIRRQQQRASVDLDTIDQLLRQRTGKTVQGVIHQLSTDRETHLSSVNPFLSLKSGTQWFRVALNDVHWIESAGDYICVHLADASHIARHTLTSLEKELDPASFCRISRSAIINLTQLQRLIPNANGEYLALLLSGQQIKISRHYKNRLKEFK